MIDQDFYQTKVMPTMSNKTIELRVMTQHPLHGVAKGKIITVSVDQNGIPFDKNWRKRLRDSKIDGCVEIVKKSTSKKETK